MWRATAWPTRNTLSTLVCISSSPVRVARTLERRAALHAGVVDEDFDRPELGLDRGDLRVDLGALRDIECAGVDREPFVGELPRGCASASARRR
jgi:hypothetical protein